MSLQRSLQENSQLVYKSDTFLVPDELQDKTIDTDEGTGTKPGVPDVPKDQSMSENESWGESGDDDDSNDDDVSDDGNEDDSDNDGGNNDSDDERTESDED
ncbi:hypothetical protein Tco_1536387 [Tanacetum coccineum]